MIQEHTKRGSVKIKLYKLILIIMAGNMKVNFMKKGIQLQKIKLIIET